MKENTIGRRIVTRMNVLRLTQKQLAQRCGLSEATLSRYITNQRTPNAKNLKILADTLYVTTDYLLNGTGLDNYTKIAELLTSSAQHMTPEQKCYLAKILFATEN